MRNIFIPIFASFILLSSCKKKIEERTGTFVGTEFRLVTDYTDTIIYNTTTETYTMAYDRKKKQYQLTSAAGYYIQGGFSKEDMEDFEFSDARIIPNTVNWTGKITGNQLEANIQIFNFDEFSTISFTGTKQ